jgi:hypothetical protein
MKILALENDLSTTSVTADLLREEARHVWELYKQGIVREVYFRADRREAVLVLEAQDAKIAQSALNTLPLVKNGTISFEIIPLVPYDGLDRLTFL